MTGQLLVAGRPVRAVDLDPAAVRDTFPGAEAARFDFTDPRPGRSSTASKWSSDATPALSNIARDMVPALEAAKRAGVKHMVLLSLQGAENNKVVPHAKIEAWLRDSGLTWTFVRPSFFMENLSTTHRSDILDRDCLMVPAGKGKTAFVAAHDVASVAAVARESSQSHQQGMDTHRPAGVDLLRSGLHPHRPVGASHPLRQARSDPLLAPCHKQLDLPLAMALVTTAIYTVARLGKPAA